MNTVELPRPIFNEEKHEYWVGGRRYPSVTEIMQKVGLIDFSMVPADRLEYARARGKAVHRGIQLLNLGTLNWQSVAQEYMGYLKAYEKFKTDTGYISLCPEYINYHPDLFYAGTSDDYGILDGATTIPDWKTGDGAMDTAAVQTAGYKLFPLPPVVEGSPYVARCGVKLNKEGTYKLTIFDKDDEDEAAWMACLTIFNWLQNHQKGALYD